MQTVYTLESPTNNKKSIYLAGPTNRNGATEWRKQALSFLEPIFKGVVYVPEYRDGVAPKEWTYSRQIDWELKYLNEASIILFWIPRDLKDLPAFTTNIEFGEFLDSGKMVIGAPDGADKNDYLKERCARLKIRWFNDLEELITEAVNKVGDNSKLWFTSDTHFGEKRTLELSKRPFSSVEDMNWEIVKRWNSVVKDNDIVYHLGDFGDPKYIPYLKGKEIYLIKGNYDTPEIISKLGEDNRLGPSNEDGDSVRINGIEMHLIHAPEDGKGKGKRALDFYLFGHIHKLQMVKENGLNVGVDCHNFTPIDEETILFYYNAITHHYDKNVFMWRI